MNTKFYLLPLLLLAVLFASCEETKEVSKFENWRARNEAFMDSLQNVYDTKPDHGGLKVLVPMVDLDVKIFYKELIAKESGASPLFTESASVYYQGFYIFGERFDGNFTGTEPNLDFDVPATFSVQSFYNSPLGKAVPGWADILQAMKVGERWKTYIPWQVAYGSGGSSSPGTIPGYSTLIFDIQLLSIEN